MLRAVLVLALFAGCPARARTSVPPAPPAPGPAEPALGVVKPGTPAPRLVVLLVVDQLPAWAFTAKRAALTGGFDRLLREGEWYTGQHPSAATLTAPGHALLGTGEPTATSGILANTWWDRDAGKLVESVRDANGAVTSAWLRVPGLGDAMAAANRARPVAGKAIAVSLKDRAAILTLGHAGTPIWYDAKTLAWTSLTQVPWLDEWNRTHPVKAHLEDVWTPLDPARLATLTGIADAAPGEVGDKGFGPTFPHDLGATKDPAQAIFAAPIGNELVLDTATQALDAEQLGTDDVPDLLIVSLSANDYIGHAWGHESWEAWDALMRLDQRLDAFVTALDDSVGAGQWAMIATSDHGASPMPKGRLTYAQIKDAANKAAATELGGGEWIADAHFPTLFLTKAALAQKDIAKAVKKIVFALRSFPGLARVERTQDIAGHCDHRTGETFRLCLSVDPRRSGEVVFIPRPGWT
ncbi:MAG: alkaline phosphatase family protein, partial [Polyangiales bacterium]